MCFDAQVDALMQDIGWMSVKSYRENERMNRLVSVECSTQVVPLSAEKDANGDWHATKAAGERRAYLKIRIPVRLVDWLMS